MTAAFGASPRSSAQTPQSSPDTRAPQLSGQDRDTRAILTRAPTATFGGFDDPELHDQTREDGDQRAARQPVAAVRE